MSTPTTFFQNVASFESTSKMPIYTVYELTEHGHMLTSTFDSKNRAVDFAREFTHTNSQVYIYKNKCIKIIDSPVFEGDGSYDALNMLVDVESQQNPLVDYESEQDEDYSPSHEEYNSNHTSECDDDEPDNETDPCLDGLYFHKYGKGYLLTPPNTDTVFNGRKYLLNGWWNESAHGWFFRTKFYDELVNHGAIFEEEQSTHSPSKSPSKTIDRRGGGTKSIKTHTSAVSFSAMTSDRYSNPRELDGFSISTYGRGLLVTCVDSNPLFKRSEPYLLGNHGFWNGKAGGWFFKKEHMTFLEGLGATVIKDESVTLSNMERHFGQTPQFEQYGRGWLLRSTREDAYKTYGKYFKGGFWMPTQSGWFFKTADKEAFIIT